MAVSAKRYIPSEAETDKFASLLSQEQLESLCDWWVKYTKSRADERTPVFSEFPEESRKVYATVFGKELMASKTKKSDAFALMQKLLTHIQRNPQFISTRLYELFINEGKMHWVVSLVSRSTNEQGDVFLVPSRGSKSIGNVMTAETIINIQNVGIAKLREILDSMTPEKIKMSNMGTLAKASRDIIATLHVLGMDYKPDQELIREYKEIEESDGKTRRERLTRYIQKNQKQWNNA